MRHGWLLRLLGCLWAAASLFNVGCDGESTPAAPTAAAPSTAAAPATTADPYLPVVSGVTLDRDELPRYESLEMMVTLSAEYSNPFDARQVTLTGLFSGPDGATMDIPGFWDGQEAWRLRFTPSQEGSWGYRLLVRDRHGESAPLEGSFDVSPSSLHGWLRPGNLVDPGYSGHYLVYHDGTPFYGIGHGEAFNILVDGFDIEAGVRLFDNMKAADENYVVWWPFWANSPIGRSYDDYASSSMSVIDTIVKDAQAKEIFLIFTVWNHNQLRDSNHAWPDPRWSTNGFNKLGDVESFFVDEEAWAWQANYYRYLIARWGYSPAVGMWQTISEINGTSAYDQADPWHGRVNAFFVANDPYRHPTTASMSGDTDWPAGHLVMDAPQVHLYDFYDAAGAIDVVAAADHLARWTRTIWDRAEKPNWVGEFGIRGNTHYPELFHNAIWAALGSGAAMTPAEWNGGTGWMRMTEAMNDDLRRLARFVTELPLAAWDPAALEIQSSDSEVRGWGVAGAEGGLFWIQDFALEGRSIEEIRASETVRTAVQLQIEGLPEGSYEIRPYDTWQGDYLEPFKVSCDGGQACAVPLPDFHADMAFAIYAVE